MWVYLIVMPNCNTTSSFCNPFASSPPLFYPCNYDPSNSLDHEDVMNNDAPKQLCPPFYPSKESRNEIMMPLENFKIVELQLFQE
jgi:hypothetical protein